MTDDTRPKIYCFTRFPELQLQLTRQLLTRIAPCLGLIDKETKASNQSRSHDSFVLFDTTKLLASC